jgi:hypothetical protein
VKAEACEGNSSQRRSKEEQKQKCNASDTNRCASESPEEKKEQKEKWNASDMTINNHQEQKPRVMS